MKNITSAKVRKMFIDYFKSKGHTNVRSSSLVPDNDNTLLFVNSGMVQFKRCFFGEDIREYKRATTYQKSVRAGGKHNDLENVGYTARHHTFFEMLGNFSFGDYFKEEAIAYAWDLLTNHYKLPKDDLWISVYYEDDEAYDIWHNKIGVPKEKIVRLGKKDNFWEMGDIGPCGPCSEIHIDRGKEFGCDKPDCAVGCDCDRYLEIWNLVFMQFEKDKEGNLNPLPKPSIDTGLGLERLLSILQNTPTNYETDLFTPIMDRVEKICGKKKEDSVETHIAMKVIADHTRAAVFLICDGVLPSNEGRGYVLRRIMRRAIRYGRNLNINKPFLNKSSEVVFEIMQDAYPELIDSKDFILNVIQNEEEKFLTTLDNGLKILNEKIEELKEKKSNTIDGETIFKLYDSFGFPVDIIKDVVKGQKIYLDLDGFDKRMQEQKKRSKGNVSFEEFSEAYKSLKGVKSNFVGYENYETQSDILLLVDEKGKEIKTAGKGDKISIITKETPFYGETGGQVGDIGYIQNEKLKIEVNNTIKDATGLIIHKGKVISGTVSKKDSVTLKIDKDKRDKTASNHTATHILHSALFNLLGKHIKQAGSFVTSNYLRFDFSHFSQVTNEELLKIEEYVNKKICQNAEIKIKEMNIDDALKDGATAIFEEKYGDKVRVISMGDFSKELCGGTHTSRTGNIGFFKIISESSIAAGVRRIEALTGEEALKYIQNSETILQNVSLALKDNKENLVDRSKKLVSKVKLLEKELAKIKEKEASISVLKNIEGDIKVQNGIKIFAKEIEVESLSEIRQIADKIKDKIQSGIVVLGAKSNDKASLIVVITKDLTQKFKAGQIIKELAKKIDGSGGGRDDMAQAGGNKTENLKEAINDIFTIV